MASIGRGGIDDDDVKNDDEDDDVDGDVDDGADDGADNSTVVVGGLAEF